MIKDAESHASEDKTKREMIEARNQADGLIYTTEKSLKDHGDKVDEATRAAIQQALDELKKAVEGDNTEEIKKNTEALATASHKLAEAMYKQTQAGAGAEQPGEEAEPGGPTEEGVVDAEFEEVDDNKD
jgi:molecular chaperone DnaK